MPRRSGRRADRQLRRHLARRTDPPARVPSGGTDRRAGPRRTARRGALRPRRARRGAGRDTPRPGRPARRRRTDRVVRACQRRPGHADRQRPQGRRAVRTQPPAPERQVALYGDGRRLTRARSANGGGYVGTLALTGDTMLGRGVAEHLATHPVRTLFGDELLEILAATDGMLLNLECCVSDRGEPWPGRLFRFRAPPRAVDALTLLGVRCVTLANNHALDFGEQALLDTLEHLSAAGVAVAGAGESRQVARAPVRIRIGDRAITVVSFTDHPAEYAATSDRPGVAYADLRDRVPGWLTEMLQQLSAAETPLLVCPHWGPNMTRQPLPYIRRVASELRTAGATLIAGHSAHVFQGVDDRVLFDLGDFIDDYAVDPVLRNDLGLLWLLSIAEAGPSTVEAVPLHLDYCHTTLARDEDAKWIRRRVHRVCRAFGTDVTQRQDRLVIQLPDRPPKN